MNYLKLGLDHILNLHAYDHLLFLFLLILPLFKMPVWSLVKLVTAFTIGHAITLVIAMNTLSGQLIYITEILIPVTIILAGMKSFANRKAKYIPRSYYYMVGVFGLIHGLGFAAAIKSMMMDEESVVGPLFQFNIGVEMGQIIVLLIYLFVLKLVTMLFLKLSAQMYYSYIFKGMAIMGMLMAVWMIVDRV